MQPKSGEKDDDDDDDESGDDDDNDGTKPSTKKTKATISVDDFKDALSNLRGEVENIVESKNLANSAPSNQT